MFTYIEADQALKRQPGIIRLHGKAGFDGMRQAGRITAQALDAIADLVKPGVSTEQLDDFLYQFGKDHNAVPATLGYRGYRHSSCASINHVVCHGIPSSKLLKEGDIVNIDVTYIVDGWHGDSSRMYRVGEISRKAERLIDVTHEAMMRGIQAAVPGNHVGDIGHAIQTYAETNRTTVVRDFVGHGLGQLFHDEPNIMHFGKANSGPELRPGMIFTIEPMINLGRYHVKILSDGWTAVTRDRSLSAQFEHSIGITDIGHEIFTTSPAGLDKP